MRRFLQSILYTMLFTTLMSSCESEPEVDLNQIPIDTKVKRFERAFYNLDTGNFISELNSIKGEYGPFFSSGAENIFWRNQRVNEQNTKLYALCEQEFADFEAYEQRLNNLIKRYYYYFGASDTIAAYTFVSSLDFNFPVVFSSPYLFIGLDLYLGERAANYYQTLPLYLQYHRQSAFLLRDVAFAMAQSKVPPPEEPLSLLDAMLYYGKLLKVSERLLGEVDEATLLVYPPDKYKFSQEHEKDMWVYFIENQLLFKTDQDLQRRFIEVAPFSKFRTKTDPETPGRIGRWFGYRIIDAYLEEYPNLDLKALINEKDARKILKLSAYKP